MRLAALIKWTDKIYEFDLEDWDMKYTCISYIT